MTDDADGSADPVTAVVLDYLPHGRSDDDRPGYERASLAHAVADDFRLFECVLDDAADVSIGDRIGVDPPGDAVTDAYPIEYGNLSGGAQSELEYVVADLVAADEDRFVEVYNEAEPITLRLHQLNLLPGIGEQLRNAILDARKRRPFDGFDDVADRVDGLHDPEAVLVDRVLKEIREDDLKYRILVGQPE
jgi:putative nucleotide binding protein